MCRRVADTCTRPACLAMRAPPSYCQAVHHPACRRRCATCVDGLPGGALYCPAGSAQCIQFTGGQPGAVSASRRGPRLWHAPHGRPSVTCTYSAKEVFREVMPECCSISIQMCRGHIWQTLQKLALCTHYVVIPPSCVPPMQGLPGEVSGELTPQHRQTVQCAFLPLHGDSCASPCCSSCQALLGRFLMSLLRTPMSLLVPCDSEELKQLNLDTLLGVFRPTQTRLHDAAATSA